MGNRHTRKPDEDKMLSLFKQHEGVCCKYIQKIWNLCLSFDDATEHDEVMFGLIHAIESYDKTFGPNRRPTKIRTNTDGRVVV